MNKRTILIVSFSGVVLLLINACFPDIIPPQPLMAQQDVDMMVKNAAAPKDKALVYFYRNERFPAGSLPLTVELDGEYAGNTSGGTYFMWLLTPGKHDFASVGVNTSTVSIDAKAGETYYIWQEAKMPWTMALTPRTVLHLVDKETGHEGVKESRLLQDRAAVLPLAPRDMDMMAKNMSAPMDKAIVYLYRNENYFGCRTLTVNVDGKYAGRTVASTYFMWLLTPGKHDFASVGVNTSTVSIDAKAGETYYIWQEVWMPWWSSSTTIRFSLHLVGKEEGQQGVAESHLVVEIPTQ